MQIKTTEELLNSVFGVEEFSAKKDYRVLSAVYFCGLTSQISSVNCTKFRPSGGGGCVYFEKSEGRCLNKSLA